MLRDYNSPMERRYGIAMVLSPDSDIFVFLNRVSKPNVCSDLAGDVTGTFLKTFLCGSVNGGK